MFKKWAYRVTYVQAILNLLEFSFAYGRAGAAVAAWLPIARVNHMLRSVHYIQGRITSYFSYSEQISKLDYIY